MSSSLSFPPATDATILKSLTAVRLDVRVWSARRKLSASDFGFGDLPPEKLASLGSKRVCNPDDLRVFGTLRARAVALLDRHGVRFLGGWALPEGRIDAIAQELQTLAKAFAAAKEAFLSRYDEAVRQWITENPGWEAVIAGSIVDAETVRARLSFAWQVFKVVPPKESYRRGKAGKGDCCALDDPLRQEIQGLSGTLFQEVSQVAREIWTRSYDQRAVVSRKALSLLKALHSKLSGLSCLDPRVAPLADLLAHSFDSLPDKGLLSGEPLTLLHRVLHLLADPQLMAQAGQELLAGARAEDVLPAAPALLPSSPLPASGECPPFVSAGAHLDSFGLW